MEKIKLKKILKDIKSNRLTVANALEELKHFPYEDIGCAKIDHHRALRRGFPEVIFCPGKKKAEIVEISRKILKSGQSLLATRAGLSVFKAVRKIEPKAEYFKEARIVSVRKKKPGTSKKKILVITAGTADIRVAEEAAVTCELMGNKIERLYDAGVAGLHRLMDSSRRLFSANVIIVIAGMEGALASVVAGLVSKPVIAVPTSIGYGASFKGIAPLLTMLNSCAQGVAVVNIDNGFGAGYMASIINNL
jgi:NCAIR mutase (PurE)-related protein